MPRQEHQINLSGPATDAASTEYHLVRDDYQGGIERVEGQERK